MSSSWEIMHNWSERLADILAEADPNQYVPYQLYPDQATESDWAIATPNGPTGRGESGIHYQRLPCPVRLGGHFLYTSRQVAEDLAAALNLGRAANSVNPDREHTANRRSDSMAAVAVTSAAQEAFVPDRDSFQS
jgi:hypothetical protein